MKREEIDEDDLPEMENLFRIFSGAKNATKNILEKESGRCKIQPIERFRTATHWVINRWWTRDEKIAAGADEPTVVANKHEVQTLVGEFEKALTKYEEFMPVASLDALPTKEVALGETTYFNLVIGKRLIKEQISATKKDKAIIPAYSANVIDPMGYVEEGNIKKFDHPCIIWGIDGNFGFNLIPKGQPFATTDHCGTIQILDDAIVPEYLLYALNFRRVEESFDRSFRASLANMRLFSVAIPVLKDRKFDVESQKKIANQFTGAAEKRERLAKAKSELDAMFKRYLGGAAI